MTKKRGIYYCSDCKVTLEALSDGTDVKCCGNDMELLIENDKEASLEKHIPIIEKIDGGFKVTVGSVLHPMEEAHYIQWIELNEGDKAQIKFMSPGQQPIADFKTDATEVTAREFCNIHGLWKS
ncbi:MAG: desulfoferrodoxin family protein [Firmicutes bacterium]|nr:desulfoferrodoxin family protein [Bacillota bacterium]